MQEYDFVLVDSRTGITDIGGICTVQLPDILVFMFTANHQSLDGAMDVVRRATDARNLLPYDRAALLTLPIPSRFDSKEEYKRAEEWQGIFTRQLGPFYAGWAVRDTPIDQLLQLTTIPYFPYWSFGEELSVLSEPTKAPSVVSHYLETLTALLAHRLANSDLLITSRDSYVDSAARGGLRREGYTYDLFISYSRPDEGETEKLADLLSSLLRIYFDRGEIQAGENWRDRIDSALSQSKHLLAVIGPHPSRSQNAEIERFIRQTLDDRSERAVIPVLTKDASPSALPSLLSRSSYYVLDEQSMGSVAADIVQAVRG